MALKTEDASLVADEFPRYPIYALPGDIPDWLICCAWHNDTCPIWGDASYVAGEGGIALAIDYPRADDREFEDSKRFGVWRTNAMSEQIGVSFDSDDWDAVKAELERLKNA